MKLWTIVGILGVALCLSATAHASKRSTHARPRTVTMYFSWYRIGQVGPYTDFAGAHTVGDICSSSDLPTYNVLTANVKYKSQTPIFCLPSSNFLYGTIVYTPGFHYQ
jgi:hypothetical protein